LFVCLGNICRSPTGEGVLQHAVAASPWSEVITIDSAGTIGYHQGRPADPRMQRAAARRGIELTSRARQVQAADLDRFDLVVAMDRENLADLQRLHPNPKARVCLLSEFLDDRWPHDVPDPYYGGEDGFEYVLDMIQAACPAILAALVADLPHPRET
jgi:protein-tyrosine phosphatase